MRSFLNIFLLFFLLIATLFFNIGLIDIRFQEINYLLGKVALDQDASKALGIVAKYELIKRRMELGEESDENYELEARIQALISGDQFSESERELRINKKYLLPVRLCLNAIRFALGKEFINPQEENKIFEVLEIGYFWERNRKYPDAIKIYNDVLGMTEISPEVKSSVLLHKAFCHSMMSEYEKSKEVYERIINIYPNTEAGILSWKLLDFIESIEKKLEKVKKSKFDNFEKAKQYYMLMDYRNAIKNFSFFLQSNIEGDKREAEVRFFKGRSHEELGELEEAVIEYRGTIRIDKTKKWAREANRRILMLGEFYDYKKKMTEEAEKQLAAYQDGNFLSRIDRFKGMMSESSIRDELLQKQEVTPADKGVEDGEVMDLINMIGDLDLTGEKEREKEIEKFHRDLIARGIKSEEEIRELTRKRALTFNPFRRPSVLKQTINENVNQLRYIYNKKLRAGVKLSGKIFVEMKIESNGKISSTEIISSNIGDKSFEEEIVAKISKWQFKPVSDSLGVLKIRYPFEFYEEE